MNVGRITRDPELKYTSTGVAVCEFSIAVSEGKNKTSFVDYTAFGKTAEFTNQYFHKGKPIWVRCYDGHQDVWEGKDGQTHRKMKFTALKVDFVPSERSDREHNEPRQPEPRPAIRPAGEAKAEEEEDDVPF